MVLSLGGMNAYFEIFYNKCLCMFFLNPVVETLKKKSQENSQVEEIFILNKIKFDYFLKNNFVKAWLLVVQIFKIKISHYSNRDNIRYTTQRI